MRRRKPINVRKLMVAQDKSNFKGVTYSDLIRIFKTAEFQAEFAELFFGVLTVRFFKQKNILEASCLHLVGAEVKLKRNQDESRLYKSERFEAPLSDLILNYLEKNKLTLAKHKRDNIVRLISRRFQGRRLDGLFDLMVKDASMDYWVSLSSFINPPWLLTLAEKAFTPFFYKKILPLYSEMIFSQNEFPILFGSSEKMSIMNFTDERDKAIDERQARNDSFNANKHVFLHCIFPIINLAFEFSKCCFELILSEKILTQCEKSLGEESPLYNFIIPGVFLIYSFFSFTFAALMVDMLLIGPLSCVVSFLPLASLLPPLGSQRFFMGVISAHMLDRVVYFAHRRLRKSRVRANLNQEVCRGFMRFLVLQLLVTTGMGLFFQKPKPQRKGRIKFSEKKPNKPKNLSTPLPLDSPVIKHNLRSEYGHERKSSKPSDRESSVVNLSEVHSIRYLDSVVYKDKRYVADEVRPDILRSLDNDEVYLTRLRDQRGKLINDYILHDVNLLGACGLFPDQVARLQGDRHYQDASFARSRFGSSGFVYMSASESGDNKVRYKYKLLGSGLFSGRWVRYLQAEAQRDNGAEVRVHTPHGLFKH